MPNEPDLPPPPGSGGWGPRPAAVPPVGSTSTPAAPAAGGPAGWGPATTTPTPAPEPGPDDGPIEPMEGVGSLTVRRHRRWPAAVGVVVVVAIAAGVSWFVTRDTFDGPSVDEDRAGLVRALRTAARAAALSEAPDAVERIEDVSVVADRGSCDGAPDPPPEERVAATMAYGSAAGGAASLELAAGAFTFTTAAEADRFARSIDRNLPVCAVGTAPIDGEPAPEPAGVEQYSRRITVQLAGLAGFTPELQLSVARSDRVVVVAAGIDAGRTDAFAAAVAVDAGDRLAVR